MSGKKQKLLWTVQHVIDMTNFLTQEQINAAYGIALETHTKHTKTVKSIHVQPEDMFTTHIARAIERIVLDQIAKELESRSENGNYKYDNRHDCAGAIREYLKD